MKLKATIFIIGVCLVVFMAATTATAEEWNGKTGIGARGGFFIPLFRGEDFSRNYEPFGMAFDPTLQISHGLSTNLTLNLTFGLTTTYDDTTDYLDTTDVGNQSFSFKSADDAQIKLSGVLLGLTGQYYFRAEERFQPYVLAGVGIDMWSLELENDTSGESYSIIDANAKVGLGVNYWLTERLALDVQAKMTFGQGNLDKDSLIEDFYTPVDWSRWGRRPFTGYFEPSIGLTYHFGGGKDTDQDGVKDKKDNCPDTPFGAIVDEAGCPLDGDGDGVFDGLDMCPDTPKGAKVDAQGCPLDSDKDGVFDGLDQCPETPEVAEVDAEGCPLDGDGDGVPDYKDKELDTPAGAKVDADGVGLDADGDGVYDGLDQCADTPDGAEVDPQGCAYDWDQDGVPDSVDACLKTPRDVVVDSTGCPLVEKIVEKIVLNIQFASGSFEIDKASQVKLDSIAARIHAYPDTKVEIAGFTDNTGAEDFNQELSQKRAEAVKDYLVSRKIEAGRMTTVGYGENPDYFIDTNDTPEGRWNNRRVEINALGEK
jgi:outer membrane protein OmpA-like peptidoglycan-associated protein/opacity protein-like surface antigen